MTDTAYFDVKDYPDVPIPYLPFNLWATGFAPEPLKHLSQGLYPQDNRPFYPPRFYYGLPYNWIDLFHLARKHEFLVLDSRYDGGPSDLLAMYDDMDIPKTLGAMKKKIKDERKIDCDPRFVAVEAPDTNLVLSFFDSYAYDQCRNPVEVFGREIKECLGLKETLKWHLDPAYPEWQHGKLEREKLDRNYYCY